MKKSGKGKAATNKAAAKMISNVLNELKSDALENSQKSDLFAIEKSNEVDSSEPVEGEETVAPKSGIVDIAFTAPSSDAEPDRLAPQGLSDEVVEQITRTSRANERSKTIRISGEADNAKSKAREAEPTIVSSSDDTGLTQPVAASDDATNTQATNASSISFADKTQPMYRPYSPSSSEASVKVSHGAPKMGQRQAISSGGAAELQILQAENLKMAQSRISELEKEVEKLRQENELLFSAGEIGRKQVEELQEKMNAMERERSEIQQQNDLQLGIYRDSVSEKDRELKKMKTRVQELEARLATDLKKIRVRERELENRLELSRMEKTTLLRAKDETLLELKRKIDFLNSELDQYKLKSSELSQKLDQGQDQMARTVRALRLALTNLEANGEATSTALAILKKAE